MVNDFFNPKVTKTIIQTADLLGLGAKNEVWIMPPANLDLLKADYTPCRTDGKLSIGHFPSSNCKGSYGILESFRKLKKNNPDRLEYHIDSNTVSWKENIERMKKCDIIIDAIAPVQGSKRYGEWGVTALEAAAMGKIVISHFGGYDKYIEEFDRDCRLFVANTLAQMEFSICSILAMTQDILREIKMQTREWVERSHSYEAVGNRMRKLVYDL